MTANSMKDLLQSLAIIFITVAFIIDKKGRL